MNAVLNRLRSVGRISRALACSLLCGVQFGPLYAGELDDTLRPLLSQAGVSSLAKLPTPNAAKFELGQLLFFDKELSGNRDTACASCHHPQLMSGDARSLPVGTKGTGLGPGKELGDGRELVPRNSPEIFHRGQDEWNSMFWDSRVSENNGQFKSPAGEMLPDGLDSVLAVQAMFPVTSDAEMRGTLGDNDVNGTVNEIAQIDGGDLPAIWQALTNRLMEIPEYKQRFAEAFVDTPSEDLGFQHAANAIATFEANAFAKNDSAWDRYLAGDDSAINDSAKRGAQVFHGQGNCAACHTGSLQTDQEHHNIGVPQLGPGKDPMTSLDPGRALVTSQAEDEFAFRTPPLRNVAVTGPWMHNGAYSKLEDAIAHYADPTEALMGYDASQLDDSVQGTVKLDDATISKIIANLDELVVNGPTLSGEQIEDLSAFLFSLTSPSIDQLPGITPTSVPSGLAVDTLVDESIKLVYQVETGALSIEGPEDTDISSLFLRLADGSLQFSVGEAAWSEDQAIVLSDDALAQSFLEYRRDQPFLLHAGDSVGMLLPAQLTPQDLAALSAVYMKDDTSVLWTAAVVAMLTGDFDADLVLTQSDIDVLSAAVLTGDMDSVFDLNGDGQMNDADRVTWVESLAGTNFGDANLNNTVDFADFLLLSDNFGQSGGWESGDFDGDGEVAFSDFLVLSSHFGNTSVAAVPEPNTSPILLLLTLIFASRRQRLRRKLLMTSSNSRG